MQAPMMASLSLVCSRDIASSSLPA
jgi:hypothetical protein